MQPEGAGVEEVVADKDSPPFVKRKITDQDRTRAGEQERSATGRAILA